MQKMKHYHDNPLISPEEFRQLIQKRTIEKTKKSKEKRLYGLRQIVEKKSKTGLDPLTIFPKKIWLNIFHAATPEDRGNFLQVHPLFHDLLESNILRDVLFPQALKVILDHSNEYKYGGDDISKSSLSPFMNLRKVSKSLRQEVDRWFEAKIEGQLHRRTFKSSRGYYDKTPGMIFNLFRDKDRLNGLIENYKPEDDEQGSGRSKSTFFVKSIEVTLSNASDHEFNKRRLKSDTYLPFKSAGIKLLELVGDQILLFKLRVNSVNYFARARIGITYSDHFLMLQQCCELMPNLKRLEVHFENNGHVEVKGPRELANLIGIYPFPTLGKLERIVLKQDNSIDINASPRIYDAILRANPHVTLVKLKMEDEILKKISVGQVFGNLEYFSWDNIANRIPKSFNLIPKTWNLKTLKIETGSQSLKRVIKSVNAYTTLEKLTISLCDIKIGTGHEFLNLPNLTHFSCYFNGTIDYDRDDVNFFFSLQFLLQSKNLKMLRWWLWRRNWRHEVDDVLINYIKEQESPDKMIDFRAGVRDLNSSNIWKLFPQLEMVEVEVPYRDSSSKTTIKPHRRPGKITYCKKCRTELWYEDEEFDKRYL